MKWVYIEGIDKPSGIKTKTLMDVDEIVQMTWGRGSGHAPGAGSGYFAIGKATLRGGEVVTLGEEAWGRIFELIRDRAGAGGVTDLSPDAIPAGGTTVVDDQTPGRTGTVPGKADDAE